MVSDDNGDGLAREYHLVLCQNGLLDRDVIRPMQDGLDPFDAIEVRGREDNSFLGFLDVEDDSACDRASYKPH
jgi:hypothetical protein